MQLNEFHEGNFDMTQNYRYFGFKIRQRQHESSPEFFAFYAPAKDINLWAEVKPSKTTPEGTQRVLLPGRKKSITRFLQVDSINTIPNNILVAFPEGSATFKSFNSNFSKCIGTQKPLKGMTDLDYSNNCGEQLEWGYLELNISGANKPALVVDGQHRLYGLVEYEQENVPLLVVAILNATLEEQAFHFIVINSKSVRVSIDNAKAIVAIADDTNLAKRLLNAGVPYGESTPILKEINDTENSPFRNQLDWDYNKEGQRIFNLTTIEQCLDHIRDRFPSLKDDDDSLLETFYTMWSPVKASFPDLWVKGSPFVAKVNINAVNEYLSETIKVGIQLDVISDIYDTDAITKMLSALMSRIAPIFWQTPWSIKVQDNANVRNMIRADLNQMVDNIKFGRSWKEDLVLPEKTKPEKDKPEETS